MTIHTIHTKPISKPGPYGYINNSYYNIVIDGIAENYFISSSSIGIVHTQGTKLNLEVTQGD